MNTRLGRRSCTSPLSQSFAAESRLVRILLQERADFPDVIPLCSAWNLEKHSAGGGEIVSRL